MEWLISIPLEWRCAALFLLGVILGGQVNRGIYRLAWEHRSIGPWSPLPEGMPARSTMTYLPILGWFWLRHETVVHGKGYWVRPLFIEIGLGLGLVALYVWEVGGQLLPPGFTSPPPAVLHAQFLSHAVLIALMLVATFIDFDEQTIPDEITVTGTLLGLTLAALLPSSLLPVTEILQPSFQRVLGTLHVSSPHSWPTWIDGSWGLFWGCLSFLGWCFAIAPWLWTTRRGYRKAMQYLVGSLVRHPATRTVLGIAVVGIIAMSGVWFVGGSHWRGLFTALVGMAFGGGLIWGVRIVGSHALNQEAMGFGDVTLMAMIGAFLGWQSALMTFFLAPFAALLISVAQYLLTRRKDIAFGPYLCSGALFVIVSWRATWNYYAGPLFQTGWLVPMVVLVCLGLMGLLLAIWRSIRDKLFFDDDHDEDGEGLSDIASGSMSAPPDFSAKPTDDEDPPSASNAVHAG